MSDFARLEKFNGMQVLCFVGAQETDRGYGPCLVTRCDPSFVIETTEGPWPDDENGWDAAKAALAEKDLEAFAASAVSMAAQFSSESDD